MNKDTRFKLILYKRDSIKKRVLYFSTLGEALAVIDKRRLFSERPFQFFIDTVVNQKRGWYVLFEGNFSNKISIRKYYKLRNFNEEGRDQLNDLRRNLFIKVLKMENRVNTQPLVENPNNPLLALDRV